MSNSKPPKRSFLSSLRDAADIARHARSPLEVAKALVPAGWVPLKVLNEGPAPETALSAQKTAEALKKICNELKGEIVTSEGKVDYAALKDSPTYRNLEETSRLLQQADPLKLDDAGRLAFWTNLYNVLSIHGVIALGVRKSVMEFPAFFRTVAYRIGGFALSLDDMENGVLRRNAPHPATKTKQFKEGDPRCALSPSRVDPRIHMALVCASKSCPPVAFYDAQKIDAQLEGAARNFVANEVTADAPSRALSLPMIFRYYEQDFGGPEGIREFLLERAEGAQKEEIRRAYEEGYEITFPRYDWSLNGVL